jgi:Flp pilus assembly protein TadB
MVYELIPLDNHAEIQELRKQDLARDREIYLEGIYAQHRAKNIAACLVSGGVVGLFVVAIAFAIGWMALVFYVGVLGAILTVDWFLLLNALKCVKKLKDQKNFIDVETRVVKTYFS